MLPGNGKVRGEGRRYVAGKGEEGGNWRGVRQYFDSEPSKLSPGLSEGAASRNVLSIACPALAHLLPPLPPLYLISPQPITFDGPLSGWSGPDPRASICLKERDNSAILFLLMDRALPFQAVYTWYQAASGFSSVYKASLSPIADGKEFENSAGL